MADPLYDNDQEGQETGYYKRPDLQAIEGGGEGDGTPQGNLSPVDSEELRKAESNPDSGFYEPSYSRDKQGNIKDTRRNRFKAHRRNWKKLTIGGGITASIVGVILSGFFSLLSLKADFVHNIIDQHFNNRVSATLETRSERLFSSYLIQTARGVGLDACRTRISSDCRILYTGITGNLFNTWKDVNFESKLEKYGIKVEYDNINGRGTITYPGGSSAITPDGLTERTGGKHTFSRELSRAFDEAADSETGLKKLWLRMGGRSYSARKLGIKKFCIFACGTRDQLSDKRIRATTRLKLAIIERVVSPVSGKIGLYLKCLTSGCDFETEKDNVLRNRFTKEILDEDAVKKIIDATDNKLLRDVVIDKLFEKVFKVSTESLPNLVAKKAIPIVGWISLFHTIYRTDKSIDDGTVSKYLADMNAQQYLDYYATNRTLVDELRGGMLDGDEASAYSSLFDDFETSKLYQAGYTGTGGGVYAQNVPLCRNGEPVPEDELICEEQKLDRTFFLEEWRQNSIASAGLDSVFNTYEQDLLPVVPGEQSAASTVGGVIKVVDGVVGGIVQGIFSLFDNIPLFKSLINQIESLVQPIINALLNLFGPVIDGTEVGPKAFEATVAGADIFTNNYLRDELGAPQVDSLAVEQQNEQIAKKGKEHFSSLSFWDRLVSTDEPDSLASKTALMLQSSSIGRVAPGFEGVKNFASSFKLSHFFRVFGNMVNPSIFAQTNQQTAGVFGNEQFAYNFDSGVIDTDPEELTPERCEQIRQEWEASKQINEETGEEYYTKPNICLLDKAVEQSLGCFYDSALCPKIEGLSSTTPAGPTPSDAIVGDPYESSVDVPCARGTIDLDIHTAYVQGKPVEMRLCALSNLASSGQESTQGSPYFITGAAGKAIVNSRVSGAWYALVNAAKATGNDLSVTSSFRTYEHQEDEYIEKGRDSSKAASPGYSSHQAGVALDFANMSSYVKGATCTINRATYDSPAWNWLRVNAINYGFKQYAQEAWHWDALDAVNRC